MKKQSLFIDAGPLLSERLSGVGHLTLHMIRGLLEREDVREAYEVKLLAPSAKAFLLDQWQLEGAKVIKIPLLARIWNNWPRIIPAPPIDIFLGRGIYIFPNFKRWPLVYSDSITYVHDISFELFPEFTEPRNLTMLRSNVPKWIAHSTLVITDSQSSKREIIDYYHIEKAKITSVYCGVDPAIFKNMPKDAVDAVRKKYGIEKPYLFFLSNLEPRKNIVRLLQAMQQLSVECKEYALVMVGGMSWQNAEINAEIDKASAAGWTIMKPSAYVPDEDVPALLSGATALVHPTLHEGFGIPVVEAMACGIPVVTSDIPVMREVAGDAALYVDPYSVDDIATGIKTILTNNALRQKLSAAGLLRAKKYNWTTATSALIGYIREIGSGRIR